MKYWQAIKLSSREFKRLTGVKRQTFRLMVRLVKAEAKKKKKVGRRAKLIIEDQILVTLQYWREYRSYFHISKDWKIDESTVCRIVKKIENILIQSRKFRLPGKKTLLENSLNEQLILMDVMESPIERPKKHQKSFYSGKQGEHTLKTQVVLGEQTGKIICLAHEKAHRPRRGNLGVRTEQEGRTHDFKLFKKSHLRFHQLLRVIGDKGYQGITKFHGNSETPIKKRTACAEETSA